MATDEEIESWKTDPDAAYAEAERRVRNLAQELRKPRKLRWAFPSLNLGWGLEGTLTALEKIPPLTSLRELSKIGVSVSNTSVSDISPVCELIDLWSLIACESKICDLSPLATSNKLRTVNIADTQVRDLTPLSEHRELTALTFDGTLVTDIEPLRCLTKMEILNFNETNVENIRPLENFTELEQLCIEGTKVEDLTPIRNCSKLGTGCNFNDVNLQGIPAMDLDPFLEELFRTRKSKHPNEMLLYLNGKHPKYGGPSFWK